MVDIDWSKAPEATHYDLRPGCEPAFMRKNHNGRDWEFLGMGGNWIMYGPIRDSDLVGLIKRPAQWVGEGPAPAGTLCNLKTEQGTMHEAEIMYSSKTAVVWRWKGHTEEFGSEWDVVTVTPIRTAEQIAADEELGRALAMMLNDSLGEDGSAVQDAVARRLYAAGWRK
jgi:hypothetical protein